MASGRLSQGRDAEVPTKSDESRSSGPGCGLPRAAGSSRLSALSQSVLQAGRVPNFLRSLRLAGTSPAAFPLHVAGSAGEGSEREVSIYFTSPLWRRQADSAVPPQPVDEQTEAKGRESSCSGHFMGGANGTAGWMLVWP